MAPRHCRESIARHGLDSSRDTIPGLAGTYLWAAVEHALRYAAPFADDVWVVECSGIPLDFGGPCSMTAAERWTPNPIPAERIVGRLTGINFAPTRLPAPRAA